MAVHRNRVIYQSEALFISPDSTGYHFTGASTNNAEYPSDYASLTADVGPGPYGMMTPATRQDQVFAGTNNNPGTNSRGHIVGWQCGDDWPEWNADGKAAAVPGTPATATVGANTYTSSINKDELNGILIAQFDGGSGATLGAAYDLVTNTITVTFDSTVHTNQDIIDTISDNAIGGAPLPGSATFTITSTNSGATPTATNNPLSGATDDIKYAKAHGTIIKQLKRIQSANYGFTVNREDVNQFGHLSRLDSIVIEAPTVNLDFSYYLVDGYNERHIEFVTDGITNALSGGFSPELYQAGSNFFILTTPEARDAVNGDVNLNNAGQEERKSVISLGNGYITDYSVDISVGSIPTASVTVEGMNIKSDIGETGNDLPAIDMALGSLMSDAWDTSAGFRDCKPDGCTGLYSLPAAVSGYDGCGDVAALRPGDVTLDLQGAGLLSKQISGDYSNGSAHIQSASLSVPMGRSTLQRLGSTFGFSKTLDVPLNVTLSVSAILSELNEANMADLLCGCDKMDAKITLYDPECIECTTKDDAIAMTYTLKGARLESENFSSTIGEGKTVDLTFVAQIAGADDVDNGFFISGKEASDATLVGQPPAWTGLGGIENQPVSGNLLGYRG
jgi:hypothetical protein